MSEAVIILKKSDNDNNIFGIKDCICCDKKCDNLNILTIGSKTKYGSRTSSFRLCEDCLKKLKDLIGD